MESMTSNLKMVKINKARLLAKLRENREEHVRLFNEAIEGYYDAFTTALKQKLEQVARREEVSHTIDLDRPRNYADSYSRAISMLEWEEDEVVTLSVTDFNSYVLDDWAWAREFKHLHKNYSLPRS